MVDAQSRERFFAAPESERWRWLDAYTVAARVVFGVEVCGGQVDRIEAKGSDDPEERDYTPITSIPLHQTPTSQEVRAQTMMELADMNGFDYFAGNELEMPDITDLGEFLGVQGKAIYDGIKRLADNSSEAAMESAFEQVYTDTIDELARLWPAIDSVATELLKRDSLRGQTVHALINSGLQ